MAWLWLLVCFPLAGGVLFNSRHQCFNGDHYVLSNCCSRDEVYFCFGDGCLVAYGCTVCTQSCWKLYRPGVATRPGSEPGELLGRFGSVIGPVSASAYTAGVLGLGEPYSLAFLGTFLTSRLSRIPNVTCVKACDLEFTYPGLSIDFDWAFTKILQLPAKLWRGLTAAPVLSLLVILMLVLEQRLLIAFLLLLVVGEAQRGMFDNCVCGYWGGKRPPSVTPLYRGNGTVVCDCDFGKMHWAPPLCSGLVWRDGHRRGTVRDLPPVCPREVLGTVTVMCQWGSAYWIWRFGDWVALYDELPRSALCTFFSGHGPQPKDLSVLNPSGAPCASCVVDQRPLKCGSCVRDCWETGGPGFDECGVGTRMTKHLEAVLVDGGVESKVTTPKGERPKYIGQHGVGTYYGAVRSLNISYLVTEVGGYWHALKCPCDFVPRVLPERIPGRPVNACLAGKSPHPFASWAPGGFYAPVFTKCNWPKTSGVDVCPGFAFDFPGDHNGFIHVKGNRQQVYSGQRRSSPAWLLTDMVLALLVVMKLAEARVVPLFMLAMWWWLNGASAATIVIIHPTVTKSTESVPLWTPPTVPTPSCPNSTTGVADSTYNAGCYMVAGLAAGAQAVWGAANDGAQAVVGGIWPAWLKLRSFAAGLAWLSNVGAYLPVVEAALAPELVCTPVVGWAAQEWWFTGCLGVMCVVAYLNVLGSVRAAVLVAMHFARGALPLVLVVAAGVTRERHSVLGLEVCFDLDGGDWPDASWSWGLAGVVSWALLVGGLMTHGGRSARLTWYARWAVNYQRVRRWVNNSPVGAFGRWRRAWKAWLVVAWFFPQTVATVSVIFILCLSSLDVIDFILEVLLVNSPNLARLARVLDSLALAEERLACSWLVGVLRKRGVLLYEHAGHTSRRGAARLREWGFALEPVSITKEDCAIVRDSARVLGCGQLVHGKPVVARRGDEVLIGCVNSRFDLPPGFVPTAPVVLHQAGKGFFGVVKTSMTGKDPSEHHGNVVVLGTSTTRSMGCCVNGVVYTTYHGTNARPMAGPFGPVNARWWSASDDVTVYPLPNGASCLQACKCQPTGVWVIRNDGALCHGTLGKVVDLDMPAELSDFRGSSGSPILCDEGHAVGMLISVLHRGSRVSSVRYTKPWETLPREIEARSEAPPVPGTTGYREAPLFLPTGAGKSTRVPNEYVKAGHKVLVLNPSIATVRAMGPYMEKLTGKHPSVYCGHDTTAYSRTTDSSLTYCTYGRFMANPRKYLRGNDVVICDELHVTDPTSILGMGRARLLARECGVRLLLFATATPPVSPMAKHESIHEEMLGSEGEVPFYCQFLPLSRYATGRHLLFCHSKVECTRLSSALASFGVNTVVYFRGKETDIPTGDVCVCATDALSTGYTGNFDTVTDCGLMVEEVVEVTLDPTITIGVKTVPAPAELRAQRRGRCGRGKAGTYYQALMSSAPAGTVRSGALWAAVEAGVSWYGLEPDAIGDLLRAYDSCPYTAAISASIGEAIAFFTGLVPMRNYPQVVWAKQKGHNWPLLVGVQRHMCEDAGCGPPANGPEWSGIRGKGPVPLLCRWGGDLPESVAPHHWVDDLQARLGVAEGYTPCIAGPVLLVGLAMAGGAILAHWTGSLVVVTSWVVNGNGNPLIQSASRGVATSGPYPVPPDGGERYPSDIKPITEAVTTLETACGWGPAAASLAYVKACETGTMLADKASAAWQAWAANNFVPPPASHSTSLLQSLDAAFTSAWDSVFTHGRSLLVGFTAAYGARRNPPLGVGASFLLGMSSSHLTHVRLAAALLLGVGGTVLGTPATGLAMAGAYFAGGSVTANWLSIIVALIGGWEGAVNAASLTFDLLAGKLQASDAWCLVSCLASPGASVAGVALGLLLWSVKKGVGQDWVNRLLTMMPRSSVMPDDFFLKDEFVTKVSTVLRKLSLSRWIMTLVDKREMEMETPASQIVWDLLDWCIRLGRFLYNKLMFALPRLRLPLIGCSTGWGGPWEGNGHLETRCTCGCVITGDIHDGILHDLHYTSLLCRHYYKRTVPVGVMGNAEGAVPLVPTGGGIRTYQIGTSDWFEAVVVHGTITVHATSCYELKAADVRRAVRAGPTYVGGVPCSWSAPCTAPALVYRLGQGIKIDGARRLLPCDLAQGARHPPVSGSVAGSGWTDEDERDLVETKAAAIEAIGAALHLPSPEAAQAALEALEEAAVSLLPHVPVIMGDDCSCRDEAFQGHFIPEPNVTEVPIEPTVGDVEALKLRAADLTARLQDLEAMALARAESIEDARAASMPSLTEVDSMPSLESSPCSSFEQISLTESDPETVVEAGLPLEFVNSNTGPSPARRIVRIRQACCCDRSTMKAMPLSFTVGECLFVTRYDPDGHQLFDERGPIEVSTPICEVIGDIRLQCDQIEETPTSYSYIWSGAPLGTGRSVPQPMTRPIGTHLTCDTTKVYVTDPDRAAERAEKVTIWRGDRKYDKHYEAVVEAVLKKAAATKSHGWTYSQAIAKVRRRAAAGYGSKVTASTLATGWPHVEEMLDKIARGQEVPFTFVTKREVFFSKTTRKPPRFIVFPPLDFRIAEKMILGDPGIVAKSILGDAYLFQYTPNQRVKALVKAWEGKLHPAAITVDATCFDSSIDEHDMQVEASVFAAASDNPSMVHALCKYYSGGPMVSPDGVPLGYRQCRSSGVLTTSSANSITCYIKVSAACRRVGIKAPSFFIAGDDCLIIYENDGTDPCPALKAALANYGYRCEPTKHASLDTAECCSAYLAECVAGGAKRWWLSTDMRKPLARASSEYSDPIGSALGTILMYPRHPIVRYVLIPHVLIMAYRSGSTPDELVMCQVQGNHYSFPLRLLPRVLVSLHGPWCLQVTTDSTKTRMEAGSALRDLGMKSLAWHRRRAGNVRTRLLRGGKEWGHLARALLWHPGLKEHPPPINSLPGFQLATPYEHHEEVLISIKSRPPWIRWILGACLSLLAALL
ncbi:polyprotein [Pegivirus platyrrhini]|uniref:Genome polyprotein n=1 Tax=Pegivirus platyrrhini TaxID=3052610 RepID=Q96898_9FLAV|nr:polyprotein [Pegivirus platyrrhini]AAC55983.1 polyprotein [Pegivirus platyrrhini]